MFTRLSQVLLSPILCITALGLQACKAKEKPEPIKIETPFVIEWEENSEVEFSISATGGSPLQYVLLPGVDAQYFSIDKDSGVLVSNTVFDFELPIDGDEDGYYSLSVVVTDSNDQSLTHSFMLSIIDLPDLGVQVDFPPEGSNTGGGLKSFNLRGKVVIHDYKSEDLANAPQVYVNGEVAKSTGFLGHWNIDVPLSEGGNQFDIKVYENDVILAETKLEFYNSFIPAKETFVAENADFSYAIDLNGRALLELDSSTEESRALLLVDQVPVSRSCEHFRSLDLIDHSSLMVVTCFDYDAQRSSLILVDRKNGSYRVVSDNSKFNVGSRFYLLRDEYLVYRSHFHYFEVVNVKTGELRAFEMNDDAGSRAYGEGFFMAGDYIYARLDGEGGSELVSYNLLLAMDSTDSVVDMAVTGFKDYQDNSVSTQRDFLYQVSPLSFNVIDLNAGMVDTRSIELSALDENPLEDAYKIEIEYAAEDYIILRSKGAANLYHLDLNLAKLSPLLIDGLPLRGAWQTAMSDDHSEFVALDTQSGLLSKVDLEEYKLIKQFNLLENTWDKNYSWGQLDYDFDNNILYQHRVIDWGGVGGNHELSSDPMLLATKVESGEVTTLLDYQSVSTYFGDQNARYRVGEAVLTDDPDILWFAMVVFQDNGAEEGVYSYSLSTEEVLPIWQFFNDSSITPDDPYLSSYSSVLDGVVLTEWNDGYVRFLNKSGSVSEYKAPLSPYIVTHDSDLDEARALIYYDGYYPREDDSSLMDNTTYEIVEYQIRTESSRVIASKDIGRGVFFSGLNFHLDENRQNLVSTHQGYLVVLDTFSGDRVLKSL